jgi:hypothetical protein
MRVNVITRGSTKSITAARAAVGREDSAAAPPRQRHSRVLAGRIVQKGRDLPVRLLLRGNSRVLPE